MKQELEQKIISLAPYMFQGYHKSPQESCLSFGMECGDGWYKLLTNLVKELIKIDKNKMIDVNQVKEKFGTLRFYYSLAGDCDDDKIDKIITKYEKISGKTCEVCGKKGRTNRSGWITCLCEKCRCKKCRK